jgi:transcriptional regulator with AAA-type ATPase domain
MVTPLVYVSKLQARKELSMEVSKISTEEVVIGNTTYVVKTNAKNVSPEFVKKTVKKILFVTLKQKS